MKISTVQNSGTMPRCICAPKTPILVSRRGRSVGVFFPRPEASLPIELKRELFGALSAEIARHIRKGGLNEEDILTEFESWRKSKRETRRRR